MKLKRPKILNWNPITQLSLSLACLTVSILFAADLLGLIPNMSQNEQRAKKQYAESIAIQFSALANAAQAQHISKTLNIIVKRNANIESAALRSANGVFESGDHLRYWQEAEDDISTGNQVIVPIYRNKQRWGSVELRYAPTTQRGMLAWIPLNQTYKFIGFVALAGLLAYWLFLKRALKELDPAAAIPDRVTSAFDALAEGVLILDDEQNVLLVNTAFEQQTGVERNKLIGYSADRLKWSANNSDVDVDSSELPWNTVANSGTPSTNIRMTLNKYADNTSVFMVNAVPIKDEKGVDRGVLTTFDDVSEMEEKNNVLKQMVDKLSISEKRIKAQNRKLHVLATRDPMTNCLNRRAFYDKYEILFESAKKDCSGLSVLMVDIDHFKRINDGFGHSVGDEVIKIVAKILRNNARDIDLVGRYGGEEFAIVLTGIDRDGALSIANRIRKAIKNSNAIDFTEGKIITASLGVSIIENGAENKEDLLDEADQALYVAKQSGRNRAICWSPELETETVATRVTEEQHLPEDAANDNLHNEENRHEENTADGRNAPSFAAQTLEQTDSHSTVNLLQSRVAELEQVAAEKTLELDASIRFDSLTGFPRRAPYYEMISNTIARGHRYNKLTAVLSIGIPSYKTVSDSLGHIAGDQLLAEIAIRLSNVIRSPDAITSVSDGQHFEISRVNSDEFGVLISDLDDQAAIKTAVTRIIKSVNSRYEITGQQLNPECNIGISVFPNDGSYAELLTRNAGLARRSAESNAAETSYCFYEASMSEQPPTLTNANTP